MNAPSPASLDGASPLFASFAVPTVGEAARAWRTILHRGVELRLPRGSLVPADGERRFDLFYLERGQVDVVFDTPDGRGRSVVSFLPGSMFNLAPAATRREASGQYLCASDAVIHRLPGALLHDRDFVARHPELLIAVVNLLGTLVLTYHTALTDLLLDNFLIRFSRFLLSLSLEREALEFAPGMTQEKCAAILGVHRATLSRAIQHLRQTGVIDGFTRRRVRILDMAALRRMAESG